MNRRIKIGIVIALCFLGFSFSGKHDNTFALELGELTGYGVLNVKDFNAVGDGQADDTGAIQNALSAAITQGNRVVGFPAGTYRITSQLQAALGTSNLAIMGVGKVVIDSYVPESSTYSGMLNITGNGNKVTIKNVSVAHHYAPSIRGKLTGIILNNVKAEVDHVNVSNFSDGGIKLLFVKGGTITESSASNNKYFGIGFQGSTDIRINGGQYNQNGGDNAGVVEGYGLTGMPAFDVPVFTNNERITITNVKAYDNIGKGIDIHNGHDVLIENNYIQGFRYNGIYAVNQGANSTQSKDVKDVKIINNFVDGATNTHVVQGIQAGGYGSEATDSGMFYISGNTIKNTNYDRSIAILIENADPGGKSPTNVIITNNTITNGASANSYIIRTNSASVPIKNVIVSGNIVHSVSASAGIGVDVAEAATITDNQITVDSGNVVFGLNAGRGKTVIQNNLLLGGGTYLSAIR